MDLERTKKTVCEEKNYYSYLNITIHNAEDIDNPSRYPDLPLPSRKYTVVFWVHPGFAYYSAPARGLQSVKWNKFYTIGLEKDQDFRFLYVEIHRLNRSPKFTDPGSSTGTESCLVGRAEIPLPTKVGQKKCKRFGLVRFSGSDQKAEGYICLTLEIKKLRDTSLLHEIIENEVQEDLEEIDQDLSLYIV